MPVSYRSRTRKRVASRRVRAYPSFSPYGVKLYDRPNAIVQSAPATSRSYQTSRASTRSWAPFGKSKLVTHHYTESILLNASAGTPADYVFSANGLYDPNISGTGHQPYAYDQLAAVYNESTVIASKCTITSWNNQSGLPFWLSLALRDDPSAITNDVSAVRETPGIVSKLLGPAASGDSVGSVTVSFDAKKFFDVKEPTDCAELRGGSVNPIEQAYYHVMLIPQNGVDDLGQNVVTVDIEYTAVWTGPKILSQS